MEAGDRFAVEFSPIDKLRLALQTSRRTEQQELAMQPSAEGTSMSQVEGFLKLPKLYDNIDGVTELCIGFMCLAWTLLAWLQMHTPEGAVWHRMYTLFIFVAVMCFITHFGSKAIKNRITYRRTGYVEYRRDKQWVPMAIAAAVAALVPVGLFVASRRHWHIATPVCLIGLGIAAFYIPYARMARWRWATFGAMVAAPLVIAALPAELVEAFANHVSVFSAIPATAVGAYWLTFGIDGALLMLSGGIGLWLYLRHTQAPAQEGR